MRCTHPPTSLRAPQCRQATAHLFFAAPCSVPVARRRRLVARRSRHFACCACARRRRLRLAVLRPCRPAARGVWQRDRALKHPPRCLCQLHVALRGRHLQHLQQQALLHLQGPCHRLALPGHQLHKNRGRAKQGRAGRCCWRRRCSSVKEEAAKGGGAARAGRLRQAPGAGRRVCVPSHLEGGRRIRQPLHARQQRFCVARQRRHVRQVCGVGCGGAGVGWVYGRRQVGPDAQDDGDPVQSAALDRDERRDSRHGLATKATLPNCSLGKYQVPSTLCLPPSERLACQQEGGHAQAQP